MMRSRAKIALTIAVGLGVGFWLGQGESSQWAKRLDHEKQTALVRELDFQVRDISEKLEMARFQASALLATTPALGGAPVVRDSGSPLVLGWALWSPGSPEPALLRFGLSTAFIRRKPPLETLGVNWLKESLGQGIRNLRPNASLLALRESLSGRIEGLGLSFVHEGQVALVIVDPEPLFRGLSNLSSKRGFVLWEDGRVLAHTASSFLGSDFSRLASFEAVSRAQKTSPEWSTYTAFDQTDVRAVSSRVGNLPLIVGVESSSLGRAAAPLVESPKRRLGQVLIAFGALGLIGFLIWRRRGLDEQPLSDQRLDETAQASPKPKGTSNTPHAPARSTVQTPARFPAERQMLISRFEAELERLLIRSKDPRHAVNKMTSFAAQLWGRPALFFSFHPESKLCVLRYFSGLAHGQTPDRMTFETDDALVDLVTKGFEAGEWVAVNDHRALVQVMVAKFGTFQFESFPICLQNEPGALRIFGFMVILNPGVEQTHDEVRRRDEPLVIRETPSH